MRRKGQYYGCEMESKIYREIVAEKESRERLVRKLKGQPSLGDIKRDLKKRGRFSSP